MDPVSPFTSPTNINTSSGSSVSTRSTTTTTSGSTYTAPHDPFVAQEAIRQFVHEQQIYATWHATHTLLKNHFFSSVYDHYISHLKNLRTKYATVTENALLKHLWKTYGKVDITDLTANESRMKSQ